MSSIEPIRIAFFETTLAAAITKTATSFTLTSGVDKEGVTLATGLYGFVLDEGSANEEIVLATCTGTTCTNVKRGISVRDGETEVTSLQRTHRRGSSVKITDAPFLLQAVNKRYVDDEIAGVSAGTAPIATGVAGENLTSGQLVYLKVSDSRWWLASASTSATCEGVHLAIVQGTVLAGASCTVLLIGRATNVSGLTANSTYYVSNTPGAIATTAGTISRVIGVARDTNEIYFDPNYNNDLPARSFVSTSSGAGDEGKVAKLNASGRIPQAFVTNEFGGDGSDGALSISSGTTTIDVGGVRYYELNYTSVSITGTGKLAFTNPHANGTAIVIKVQGDVTLTSSTAPNIDASGIGSAGGVSPTTSINPKVAGTEAYVNELFTVPASAKSILSATLAFTVARWLFDRSAWKYPFVAPGSGGASCSCAFLTGSPNGGGNGGGVLILECNGAINFTVANGVSVAGKNGANATCGGNSHGADGGGGGVCILFYRSVTAVTGTVNVAGGTGGAPTGAGDVGVTGENGKSFMQQIS